MIDEFLTVIRQANRAPHALRTHAPAMKSTRLLRVRRYLQRGRSISSILRGCCTRTRNVSEYMLVLALWLVHLVSTGRPIRTTRKYGSVYRAYALSLVNFFIMKTTRSKTIQGMAAHPERAGSLNDLKEKDSM